MDFTTCAHCLLRPFCCAICKTVEDLLPGIDAGSVHDRQPGDIVEGRSITTTVLNHEQHRCLTEIQREVVRLYYRERLSQPEIAERLCITQQAVNDRLQKARYNIGQCVKRQKVKGVYHVTGELQEE